MSSPINVQNSQGQAQPNASSGRLGAAQVVAIILGAIVALVGIGSLLGAGVLSWANATRARFAGLFLDTQTTV